LYLGRELSLLRQGISIGTEYGAHSIIMLARIAEMVEESVYEPGSLCAIASGIRFVLRNPPLRIGAFSSIRVRANQTEVSPDRVRFRTGTRGSFRSLESIDRDNPFTMVPGQRTEVEVDWTGPLPKGAQTILLSLRNVAIPPLVWFEFVDAIHEPRENR
jgi:hypothetical protein